MNGRLRSAGVVAVAALAVTMVGCGSSSSSGSKTTTGNAADVKAAQEWLAIHQNEKTLPYKIPATSPPLATNKKVVVVLAGAASLGGKLAAEGVTEAGHALGWSVTTIDGELKPEVWTNAVGNAITAKANAIVLDALPPEAVAGPVAKAKAAGIKVVSEFNPVPLSQMVPGVLADASSGGVEGGMAQAAWIAAHSNGVGKIIFYDDKTLALTRQRQEGFETGIKQFCPDCQIIDRFTVDESTMEQTLEGQMAGDIRRFGTSFTPQNPGYIVAPHDVGGLLMLRGIDDAQAQNKVKMVSIDAVPAALQDIREGNVFAASWAQGLNWVGWSSADELNRIFNNEPPASYQGSNYVVQSMMLDKEHINPSGPWTPPYDYRSAFKSLWASAK
jgi:ribose transport system substrate-binding protein